LFIGDILDDSSKESLIEWKNKGNTYAKLGEYQKAIECYSKVLEIDPKYCDAWNNIGYCLTKLGKCDDAEFCKNKIIQIKGTDDSNQNLLENIRDSNIQQLPEKLETNKPVIPELVNKGNDSALKPTTSSSTQKATKKPTTDNDFCLNCGQILVDSKSNICPKCGIRLSKLSRFGGSTHQEDLPPNDFNLARTLAVIFVSIVIIAIIMILLSVVNPTTILEPTHLSQPSSVSNNPPNPTGNYQNLEAPTQKTTITPLITATNSINTQKSGVVTTNDQYFKENSKVFLKDLETEWGKVNYGIYYGDYDSASKFATKLYDNELKPDGCDDTTKDNTGRCIGRAGYNNYNSPLSDNLAPVQNEYLEGISDFKRGVFWTIAALQSRNSEDTTGMSTNYNTATQYLSSAKNHFDNANYDMTGGVYPSYYDTKWVYLSYFR
jgi:hypothetical protein